MTRAAVYARYSTGNQSPLSVEDQLRLCREKAAALGAHVVRVFSDAETSGFVSGEGRPQYQALLAFARAGGCDLVIAEHSNRLARDGEAGWHVFNLFRAIGVAYVTVHEGEMTVVGQAVSTLMSEMKGEEVSDFTRRGLRGVVEAGRSAGGLTYGYRKVLAWDADGEPRRGLLEIDPAQAEVVRRIFRAYADGASPKAIAHTLNAEGVPGPRGGPWNMSTIAGNAARGVGIIHNELYVGVRLWGRRLFVKDRATGQRRGRPAEGAPVRHAVPDLRLVDDELWAAVRARHAAVSTGPMATANARSGQRRPTRLLSGLIKCGLCGAPMHKAGPREALRCATRIEQGACGNTRAPAYSGIEARVIAAIRDQLLAPDAIALAIAEIQTALAAAQRTSGQRQAKLAAELAEVKRRAARILDLAADAQDAAGDAAIREKLADLKTRRMALEADLADLEESSAGRGGGKVATLGSAAAGMWRRLIDDLLDALADPDSAAARDRLRVLVHEVRVTPAEGHGRYEIAITGDLAPLLQLGAQTQKTPAEAGVYVSQSMGAMGAGTRVPRGHTLSLPFVQAA